MQVPSASALVAAFVSAWNRRDTSALLALCAEQGRFSESGYEEGLCVRSLKDAVERWTAAFPDHRLSIPIAADLNEQGAVEWLLEGRNQGPWRPDLEATGAMLKLPGSLHYQMDQGRFTRLVFRYDRMAVAEQLGLTTILMPPSAEQLRYGYSLRAFSGNAKPPGVIALTWIQAADETEKARIRAHSQANVRDFLTEPGFISIVTGFAGLRGFTVTAWEDEAAMRRALSGHHAQAMRDLFGERFVASVWTSVWQPTRINRLWQRCTACGALEDVSDGHGACSRCGASLGAPPSYW